MCPKYVAEIMKKSVVEMQIFINFDKSQNLPESENVFRGSIRKSFRKEFLLHQMKCNFLCKIFASNPSILAFAVVTGQAMHASVVA